LDQEPSPPQVLLLGLSVAQPFVDFLSLGVSNATKSRTERESHSKQDFQSN